MLHDAYLVPSELKLTDTWFTGSIQRHDALCVLPLNILNEKIFIFLWFWFIILSVLSGLALLYSTAIAMYLPIRETVLKRRFKFRTPGGVATIVAKTQVTFIHLLFLKLCLWSSWKSPGFHNYIWMICT
jgi:hypothetical protein